MPIYPIKLNEYWAGTVETGEANVTCKFFSGKRDWVFKEYVVDLSHTVAGKIKFSVYKDPDNKWSDFFIFPKHPDVDSAFEKLVKDTIDQMGI